MHQKWDLIPKKWLNKITQRLNIRIMLENEVAQKGKGKQERYRAKKELQIDRKKDRMDLFSRLWHSSHSASLPCSGRTVGPSSAQPGACSICLHVDGTGRGGVFEIPCIPATEHKCPAPDINQLFQVRREGFSLGATLSLARMYSDTRL